MLFRLESLRLNTVYQICSQESISPTCLRKAFMCPDCKRVKIQSSCQYIFALLGSALVKAATKMMMKLTPGCWSGLNIDYSSSP